jgi:hypothetical protein
MIRTRPLLKSRRFMLSLGGGFLAVFVLLAMVSAQVTQNPPSPKNGEALSSSAPGNDPAPTAAKPKADASNPKLEKTKTDAAQLCALADQLRDELNKMNINVLSLDVIQKTEEVEKLAKKIKGEAYER